MKIRNRYELCYVNRLLQEVYVYFNSVNDILRYVDSFEYLILYFKSCYDYKEHKYLYNGFFIKRSDFL